MKSVNFEFLRERWPYLATLGGFAEQYIQADPASALVKVRLYVEQMAETLYELLSLQRPYQANLIDLLEQSSFQDVVPTIVIKSMHAIRINGNKAAHGADTSYATAFWLLKESHKLGQWFYITFAGGDVKALPGFDEKFQTTREVSKSKLKKEKKEILQKLASQEAQMQKLLEDLAQARKEAKVAVVDTVKLRERLQAAKQAVSVLDFDEASTRKRLIDNLIADAGWKIGADGKNTPEVRQEFPVEHQPTDSKVGYADYVLFDTNSELPLAVIEAKKTSRDPEQGREQARLYAEGLATMYNCQQPIIYYTNGFDIRLWDEASQYPPRTVYGFYSKDSTQYLLGQRKGRQELTNIIPDKEIAGRLYQMEAITRVLERFQLRRRRSLLVQATGTGKTRVAISICESLIRAGWARRILFLCDRRELRKQAHNTFKAHLPNEPRVNVTASTYRDRDKRIYLATYPAMMKVFETFDVGFFDLIIADESHRSIYNRHRELFLHFDALQVGLTATPRSVISHNTYKLFNCDDDVPTSYYGYRKAVEDGYLCPFEVESFTTAFLREGIKYSKMTEQQRRQLEEDEIEPEEVEFDQRQVDKYIFNLDTNRRILRNLMEHGVKIDGGSKLGKTIIFARSHRHAEMLQKLFEEEYPQYGGNFCRVIDNYVERAEELIDDFKGIGKHNDITVAISVDMLDTGIDVPEIVNLVFAKPVYSYVKFWQMIGRGTRLCENLFGANQDKKNFLVFDHWGNFDYFGEDFVESESRVNKSLQQILFEDRIRLGETAIETQHGKALELATDLLLADVKALPDNALAIREKLKMVKAVQSDGVIKSFEDATVSVLKTELAPLMQWRDITGYIPAIKFDMLCSRLQTQLLKQSSTFENLRGELINQVQQLQINLTAVKAKLSTINMVKKADFWSDVSIDDLEKIRLELRDIMKYRAGGSGSGFEPKIIDVLEEEEGFVRSREIPKLEGLDLIAYRNRVQKVLTELIEQCEPLRKIKAGKPITESELDTIAALVIAQEPGLNIRDLIEYHPDLTGDLSAVIRTLIGLDADMVEQRFTNFAQNYKLNSIQMRFLDLIKNHIRKYGAIELTKLYEDPFTAFSQEGLDGIFPEHDQADELIDLIESINNLNKEFEKG